MQRRALLSSVAVSTAALGGWCWLSDALAGGLFTSSEGTLALRTALERGARAAVAQLGRADGFLGNDKVRIALPGPLEQIRPLLKGFGKGRQLDELVVSMNHAAEQAVPLALPLLKAAIKSMSVGDAQHILTGADTSVTEFFASKTRQPLNTQFLPIVSRVTDKLSLARRYNDLAGKGAGMGLIKGEQANVQRYVTGKTLDGLFLVIGEQEQLIRRDPVGTGSAILKKVFGSL